MNILIADSDRDFLMSFQKVLEYEGHNVSTVFDGTQVITKITESSYDIVILEQNIPRIDSRDIIKLLNEEQTPVIMILDKKINSEILLDDVLANAYLNLPFLPNELTDAIQEIAFKKEAAHQMILAEEGIEIDVPHYSLCGKIRLTNEEINIFEDLHSGKDMRSKSVGPYINSLNNKLEALNKKTRIRYVINEGYRLVTGYE